MNFFLIHYYHVIIIMMMSSYLCNKDEGGISLVSFFLLRGGVLFCRDYLESRLHIHSYLTYLPTS